MTNTRIEEIKQEIESHKLRKPITDAILECAELGFSFCSYIENSNEKYFALIYEEKDLFIEFVDMGKKCVVELSSIEEDVDEIDELPITYSKGTIGKVMRTTRRIAQLEEIN